jgi:F-type H+-transporting ATPase subunit b
MREKRQALAVLALLPLFVFAETGEKSGPSGLAGFLGMTINFLILFGGLTFLLAKPIRAFLDSRVAEVRRSMDEASAARAAAEERLSSIRRRLSQLAEEAQKIRALGQAEGQKEKSGILEAAAREAEKVRQMTGEEIEARVQAARRELREFAAELAVSLARTRIERRLTPDLHARLIDESIATLGRRHEESHSG